MIYNDGVPGWAKAGYPLNRERAFPKAEVPFLKCEQLKEMLENAYVIDVRMESRYNSGRIKGSQNFPIHLLSKRYTDIPKEKKVVVVDQAGNPVWIPACWFLKNQGYSDLYWLQGGMDAWEKGGFPIEK